MSVGRSEVRDAGVGAVLALGMIAAVMVAALLVAAAVSAVHGGGRAQAVADAAALAGAVELRHGRARADPAAEREACATAIEAARLSGGRLSGCDADAATGVVRVTVVAGRERAARAGPGEFDGGPG